MFNKIYKTIHNQYSKFFKIFYFLRYLLPIFLAAIALYISIPKLFDYEKKVKEIENFLSKNYQLTLEGYSSIKYNIFPFPNISLENTNLSFGENSNNLKAKKIFIYLNLDSIYNNNFSAQRVFINDNQMILEIKDVAQVFDFIQNINLKLKIKNLDLDLTTQNNSILKLKNINFSNYGFKKDKYIGTVFDKKFEIYANKEKGDLKFKILKTGISANLKFSDFKKDDSITGTSKINILNNYLKFNYLINKDKIILKKSKFRNKDLSLSFQNLITLTPYFEMNSDIKIDKINNQLFGKLNLNEILIHKNIIKKLNGIYRVKYKEKKILQYNLIKEYESLIYLENGRMNEKSVIKFHGAAADCINEVTLIEEFPRLYFKCQLKINNIKEFNKHFSISKKLRDNFLNLYFKGSINIFKNKINFEKIDISEIKYQANEEDKNFFKKNFEDILLSEGIFNIFKTQKIKYFINEII